MKSIPVSLRNKLLNKIKAESSDSQPNIKVIATQTSYNTLLTEPIHEDIDPNYGDVAIRQMMGESEPSMAYSICIDDDGEAVIRKRTFPALMDYPWEYVWTFGEADDVAIEFDGTWTLDGTKEWYYLLTEEFPYIFTIESGALYVQKWKDSTTRFQLVASGVTQISTCKGWHNSIDADQDQGLIVAYLKTGGGVYYRAYCEQDDGTYSWELEHQVTDLGTGNTSIQLFRTNDFRIGFLVTNSGTMKFALTDRTYAGMSVRPESTTVYPSATMENPEIEYIYVTNGRADKVTVAAEYPYLMIEDKDADTEIRLTGADRINRSSTWYSYGITLTFDKALEWSDINDMKAAITITGVNGSLTQSVQISSLSYDSSQNKLTILFQQDIYKTYQLNVDIAETRKVWYKRSQNYNWFLKAMSTILEPVVINKYGYDPETVTVRQTGTLTYASITEGTGCTQETVSTSSSGTLTYEPVSTEPI